MRHLVHSCCASLCLQLVLICGPGREAAAQSVERQDRLVMQVAFAADRFRIGAARNPKDAVGAHGIDGFQEKWSKSLSPNFRNREEDIGYFFAYALILVGSADASKSVVAYYNPWVDAMMLTAWRERLDGWKITDFVVHLGETVRSEAVGKEAACPPWLRAAKPLAGSVTENCGKVIRLFQDHFESPRNLPFPAAKPALSTEAACAVVRERIQFRAAYARERFGGAEGEKAEGEGAASRRLVEAVRKTQSVLIGGRRVEIQALAPENRDPYVAETIGLFPLEMRAELRAHWFIAQGDQTAVVLSSSVAPRWFVLLFLNLARENPIQGLGLYDFELMRDAGSAPAGAR